MRGKDVPPIVLAHWYVCGRKVKVSTETVVHLYAPHKQAYQCEHCGWWHVGRRWSGRMDHAARQGRKMAARKAWDQQAYRWVRPCG